MPRGKARIDEPMDTGIDVVEESPPVEDQPVEDHPDINTLNMEMLTLALDMCRDVKNKTARDEHQSIMDIIAIHDSIIR